MTADLDLRELETLLVDMHASAVLAGEDCLSAIRELAATCPTAEAAAFASRIRHIRDLAANACILWQQTLECAGASTWTGYGVQIEERSPSVTA